VLTWQAPAGALDTGRMLKAVSGAIAAIGEPDFEAGVLGALRGFVAVEHCSTFLSGPGEGVRCLGAASFDGSSTALFAAERYVASYWQDDPALRRLRGTSFEDRAGVGRITSEEIRNPAYRRECYEAPRVLDRVTVYRDVNGRRLFLSVFRGRRMGFFAPDEVRALGTAADALAAAVARHHRLRVRAEPEAAADARPDPAKVSRWLRALCPRLSEREVEVCALLVLGRSADEVADTLEVRTSSVVTYRRRAYAKLGVSSSLELAAACLRAAGTLGP
jgi:DNA-binding CsgD family transcriptional regulator